MLVVVIGIIGSNPSKQPALMWDVSGRSITSSRVGETDATQVSVTNNGTYPSNLILYLNAKDD